MRFPAVALLVIAGFFTSGCALIQPIDVTIMEGDQGGVETLLAMGGDPNGRSELDGNHSLLQLAVIFNQHGIAESLLDAGADPNLTVSGPAAGLTAMHFAAGNVEMMRLLISRGARINFDNPEQGLLPQSAVRNCIPCMQLLIDSGVDAAESGNGALAIAAMQGNIPVMDFLLDAGVKDNAQDFSLYNAASQGKTEAVRRLVKAGFDVNKPITGGRTPLMVAAEAGAVDTVKALLESKAKVNAVGDDWSALALASWAGHRNVMDLLHQKGANPGFRKKDGRGINELFNGKARELEAQRLAQLQEQQRLQQIERERQRQAQLQRQQEEASGFQWGKMLAMTAGVAIGASELDSTTQMDLMSGIIQDSMAGNQGMSNLEAAANNSSQGFGSSAAPGGQGAAGSYPARPNTLDGHPACSGYTVQNYKSQFAANQNGPDVQLHTHCAGAYNYYSMYLNAIRQGYSQADSDRTYAAFSDAARVTIAFYQGAM